MKVAILVVASAACTIAFRFLTISFNNDHYVHLTAAQQMLFGEWPTRDFIDIGRPLQIAASAASQRLLGETLFAEAILVSTAFGIASAAVAAVVLAATGSATAAAGAVLAATAAFPRTYSYPKPLALAAGLLAIAYFLRQPTAGRRALMALATTIAFLFRHDLGIFLAVGGAVAAALGAPAERRQDRDRAVFLYLATVAAMIAPYLVYVQLNGGLWNYVATALQQNQTEAGYVWPNPLSRGVAWEPQLVYAFHLLPVAVLAVCAVDWRRGRRGWHTQFAICAAAVAAAANFGLIRDLLIARLPDAAATAAILGTWLGHRAWRSGRPAVAIPALAVLLATAAAAADMDDVGERLHRAGFTLSGLGNPASIADRVAERAATLHDRRSDPPSRIAAALTPFLEYLDRCTTARHRLFLGGMIPEVAYLARRPFAGGGYEHYNFSSPVNQRRVIDRLRQQIVPFALIPSASASDLRGLTLLSAYLENRYVPLADISAGGEDRVRILVDPTVPAASRDAATGWPCYTPTPQLDTT